jgi:membrane associated rhomboid family serine protease
MLDDRSYMRSPYRPGWSMTKILLVSLVGCFLAQLLLQGFKSEYWVMQCLALSAEGLKSGKVYQLITFQFLHGGPLHLLMNVIALYFFGRAVEEALGRAGMLKLYLISGVVGGLLQVALAFAFPSVFGSMVVGASAGIFGLVAAFATRAPEEPITILLYVLPVTLKAKTLLICEACYAIASLLVQLLPHPLYSGNVAHAAHLGGMLTGIAWIKLGLQEGPSLDFLRRRSAKQQPARVASKRSARSGSRKAEEVPSAEFISREVDPILEKISAHGIHSLTERERQILEAARNRMARR